MEQNSIFGFGPSDSDTIRKWLIGGAGVGAGMGLITSFINYLNGLKKHKSDEDDDTLYVYKKASLEDDSYFATPTAIMGGIGTGLLSYALIRKLYTKFKLKEAQQELDRAQKAFIQTSGYEVSKKKKKSKSEDKDLEKDAAADEGRAFTGGEVLLSLPVLLPSLVALGAGITAYNVMDKKFPTKLPKKPSAPKRIEVIEKPEEDQEEYEKNASAHEQEVDGREYLIRMALLTKSATSDLANLVAATASGDFDEFEKTANTIGFIEALDTVKGAAQRTDIDPFAEHLAISLLAKKASICEQVGILAASEFAETQKSAYLQACALEPKQQQCLYKAACCLGRAMRYELSAELGVKAPRNLEKSAATLNDLGDLSMATASSKLLRLMALNRAIENDDDDEDTQQDSEESSDQEEKSDNNEIEEGSSSTATDTSGEESDINLPNSPSRRKTKNKVKFVSNTKSRRGFLSNIEPDVIDKILTP